MAFCPGFNEPLACEGITESLWPHQICRKPFINKAKINLEKFREDSLRSIFDYGQTQGRSEDQWRSIINSGNSPFETRKLLEKEFPSIDFFFYRWNQSSLYFKEWVKNGPDHLWLAMIRNPMDRACSSYQKHNWTLHQSLENTVAFAEKLEEIISHKQFYLLHYEDLINYGEPELEKIYSFLGEENKKIKIKGIKGSNGKDFKPQSSRIKERHEKEDGYLSATEKFSGLYDKQTMRYQTDIWAAPDGSYYRMFTDKNYRKFKERLFRFNFYSRYFAEGTEPIETVDKFLDMPFKETPNFAF